MQNNDEVVILDLNKKLASKKAVKFTLRECLNDLTKDRLNKFAANYKVANRSKMKKDELIEAICNEMLSMKASMKKIQELNKESLEILKKISASEKIAATKELIEGSEELMNLALVFTYLEDDTLIMVTPNELKLSQEAKDTNGSKISDKRYNEVAKYVIGFAEAYGMYEPQILLDTFNNQNDEKLSETELIEIVNLCKNKTSRVLIHNGYIIQDSLLMIESGVEHLEKLRKGKIYHGLTKEDVHNYANGIYIEMTDAHHSLRNKLIEVCHNNEKVGNDIFEDICDSLVFSDLNTHFIISEFTRRKLQVNTVKEFEIILSLAKKVNDNTRKWGNKGFTKNELELLASKKIVGRNEPCICGSGKKYKKCCGR